MPVVTFPNHGVMTANLVSNTGPGKWRTSLDVAWAVGGVPQPSDALTQDFITWIRGITRDDATLQSVALRNWTRGAQPFFSNPAIWVDNVNLPCNAYSAGAFPGTPIGSPTLGEVCARLIKTNEGSALRASSLFIRNIWFETMISSTPGGPPIVAFGSNVNPALLDAFTLAKIGPHLQLNPLPRFVNIHYSAKHAIGPLDSAIQAVTYKATTMHNLSRKGKN